MTTATRNGQGPRGVNWRLIGWGAAASLFALPAIAMRFTAEVNWDETDFIVWGAMLLVAGALIELGARVKGGWFRAGVAAATFTGFFLVWVNLAVGVIGSENHDANLLFAGVLALVVGVGAAARFRPAGMAAATAAAAVAHLVIAGVAVAMRWGAETPIWPRDVIGGGVLFAGLWLVAALLFRRAARAR